jgi:hypothetical protein
MDGLDMCTSHREVVNFDCVTRSVYVQYTTYGIWPWGLLDKNSICVLLRSQSIVHGVTTSFIPNSLTPSTNPEPKGVSTPQHQLEEKGVLIGRQECT